MRILVIENYAATPLGLIARPLAEASAELDLRRAWEGGSVPETAADHDALILLGGEQSAVEDAEYPYLAPQAALAARFGAADKPVLGVCLGAQLIARAYGATNILDRPVEFGWREVRPTVAGRRDPLMSAIGERAALFQWHRDTFTLPAGARHLATSEMTPVQAFVVDRAVYGFQFHMEADRVAVEDWSRDYAAVIADYAPDWETQRLGEAARHAAAAEAVGLEMTRRWLGLIG
jgi:GMP synthase (glutamine-hydrolysing)